MKRAGLRNISVEELVERFVEIAFEQHEALLAEETAKYNRLFDRMQEVEDELGSREGDQRRALLRLFNHPNAQVRLKAATATLALVPEDARAVLQAIKDRHEFPQALHAGMTLWNLDQGVFKPA
jgi:hypothetical protein